MKKLLPYNVIIVLIFGLHNISLAQTDKLLSEFWIGDGGLGAMFYKNSTMTDDSRNVYVAGSTINGLNDADLMIQKFDKFGDLLWAQTYAGAASGNDMAVDVLVGNTLNGLSGVYVVGTVFDSISNDQDLIVQKYNTSGALLWTYKYNSPSSLPRDIGTAITTDGTSIFVTGASTTDST